VTATAEAPAARDASSPKAARRERLQLLLRSATFLTGAVIVAFWVFCAAFGELMVPTIPMPSISSAPSTRPRPITGSGPTSWGATCSAVSSSGLTTSWPWRRSPPSSAPSWAQALGLLTGYVRGFIDDAVGRLVDAVLALPLVIIALLALAALGSSNVTVVIVIGVVFAPIIARTVRSAVLSERELDYIAAARLRGEGSLYIMFAEILPNVIPPILVESTVRLGYAIFTVATLSFIGFGIQPPSPDWGLAISASYGLINGGYWWTVLFDALAIASLVVGVNLLADGIQAAFET